MMRRLLPFAFAAAALAGLGGCGLRDAATTAPSDTPATEGRVAAAPDSPATSADPGSPGTPKMPEVTFRPETFAIRPAGTGGWKPTAPAPPTGRAEAPLATLGTKVDRAFRDVGRAFVQTQTNFDIAGEDGGRFNGKATLRFDGPGRYSIEFYTPETKATLNEIVASDGRRAKRFANQWAELSPARPPDRELDDAQTADWPMRSLSEMFAPFTSGHAAWGPLLTAWSQGRAGYTVTVEERTSMVDGEARPFIRVVAKTEQGRPTTVEVIFDGESHLPLTLRVNRKEADGKESKIMWNGRWGFGGQHDPKSFEIPVPRPR